MQTKSVVDKTCGHGALPVGGFMATPIGAHVLSFCQKYPSAGRTLFWIVLEFLGNAVSATSKLLVGGSTPPGRANDFKGLQ